MYSVYTEEKMYMCNCMFKFVSIITLVNVMSTFQWLVDIQIHFYINTCHWCAKQPVHIPHVCLLPALPLPAYWTQQVEKPSECLQSSEKPLSKDREPSNMATSPPVDLLIIILLPVITFIPTVNNSALRPLTLKV